MTRLVLATGNPGKVAEFREALADTRLVLVAAPDVGVPDPPPEEGATYEANAFLKAGHAARASELPALADDSGLEVDALRGAPGVHSARFGGDLSDGERIAHLLAQLRGVAPDERTARFRSVLVLATPDGEVRTFEGACEGQILSGPRGSRGFGYDPVFYSDALGTSFGEADAAAKRGASHRGAALRAFRAWLDGEDGARLLP